MACFKTPQLTCMTPLNAVKERSRGAAAIGHRLSNCPPTASVGLTAWGMLVMEKQSPH